MSTPKFWNVGGTVHVDAPSPQPPYERICQDGEIIEVTRNRLLVRLEQNRETLWFKKSNCAPFNKDAPIPEQECPNCHSGTIGLEGGRLVCRGECGCDFGVAVNTRVLGTDSLCQEVAEVLAGFDSETIERIANMVLVNKVRYVGDDLFEQKLPE